MIMDKWKDYLLYTFGFAILIYIFYDFFLEDRTWYFIIYSLLVYFAIAFTCLILGCRKTHWKQNLFTLFLIYFVMSGGFTASPYLQKLEFELTHLDWLKVSDFQVVKHSVKVHQFSKQQPYSYIDLKIKYQCNDHQEIIVDQKNLNRQYAFWMFEPSDHLIEQSKNVLQTYLKAQHSTLYVHPIDHHKSKIFLNHHYFDFRSSIFIKALYFCINILVALILLVISIFVYLSIRFLIKKYKS